MSMPALRLGKNVLDLSPLRGNRAYTRLWVGTSLSAVGGQLSSYAILLESWNITHSSAAVGGTGLAIGVPRLLFSLFGGTLSDRADRRRVVLLTTIGLLCGSLALTVQAAVHAHDVRLLYVIAAAKAVLSAIAGPARATFIPSLLDKATVPAGIALSQATSEWAVLAGPLLASWLTDWLGLTACFLLDSLSYLASLYGVSRLPALSAPVKARPGLAAVADGLRYIRSKPAILGCLLADLSAMVLAYPSALLPEFNSDHFGGSPQTLAYLLSAMALGGFASSILSGRASRSARPGRLVLGAAAVWGAALAAAGATHLLWVVLVLVAIAGAADTISVIGRGIVVQLTTEDEYRGRVNAASQAVGVAGPALGNFRAGLVGSFAGAGPAIAIGGLSVLAAVALIAKTLPTVRRFTTAEPVPAD